MGRCISQLPVTARLNMELVWQEIPHCPFVCPGDMQHKIVIPEWNNELIVVITQFIPLNVNILNKNVL